MRHEVFNLFTSRIAKGFDPTEIGCIGFHQVGIELMLANQLAKTVANFGTPVVSIGSLRRQLFRFGSLRWLGERTDFLNRADSNAVRLPQGSVDGTGFCDSHFRSVDKKRDIGRISIAITDKASTILALVDSGLERPPLRGRIAKIGRGPNMNSGTTATTR